MCVRACVCERNRSEVGGLIVIKEIHVFISPSIFVFRAFFISTCSRARDCLSH